MATHSDITIIDPDAPLDNAVVATCYMEMLLTVLEDVLESIQDLTRHLPAPAAMIAKKASIGLNVVYMAQGRADEAKKLIGDGARMLVNVRAAGVR